MTDSMLATSGTNRANQAPVCLREMDSPIDVFLFRGTGDTRLLPGKRFSGELQRDKYGSLTGADVAQVYLRFPSGLGEPPCVWWGGTNTAEPGAQQQITVTVKATDASHPLSYWDTGTSVWKIAEALHHLCGQFVGQRPAGRDIPDWFVGWISIAGDPRPPPRRISGCPA